MKICMILEGSYPFVRGGVSSWMHNYIQAMPEYEFVLWCIGAHSKDRNVFKYELPKNVTGVYQIFLDDALRIVPSGGRVKLQENEVHAIYTLIAGESTDWDLVFELFQERQLNPVSVLTSEQFLKIVQRVCLEKCPYISFADYFHTVRSMILPELYIMTGDVPKADIYHSTATGYSGILGSLGKWKNKKPYILTEHGIYTREREEELIRAKWVLPNFRNQWIQLFYNFSSCAYEHADMVTSLYDGASRLQGELGCSHEKLRVIANGVAYDRFKAVPPKADDGWISIGAVVRIAKIKDVKTMIYAFAELKTRFRLKNSPKKARLFILGDTDDEEYKEECVRLIEMLDVKDIIFTGSVNVVEYLEKFDFTILTSISEAQPLSVLESFAAARPAVVTDVGCCRELIYGRGDDDLGQAGFIVTPMGRDELANALERMCEDDALRERMGKIGQKRVENYYTQEISMNQYKELYKEVRGHGRNWV